LVLVACLKFDPFLIVAEGNEYRYSAAAAPSTHLSLILLIDLGSIGTKMPKCNSSTPNELFFTAIITFILDDCKSSAAGKEEPAVEAKGSRPPSISSSADRPPLRYQARAEKLCDHCCLRISPANHAKALQYGKRLS